MPASIEKVNSGGTSTSKSNTTNISKAVERKKKKTETVNVTNVSNPDFYVEDASQYYVQKKGYMVGDETGFNPNGDMTRAQMVQILYAMEGKPSGSKANLSDVKSGEWYADAVAWAQSNGIVAGHTDGTFRPNDKITNEQMAAIMKKYAEFKGKDTSITNDEVWAIDKLDRSEYSRDALTWANQQHMFNVQSILDLKPKDVASRQVMADMLRRYDQIYNRTEYMEVNKQFQELDKIHNTEKLEAKINSVSTNYSSFDEIFNDKQYGGSQDEPAKILNYNSYKDMMADTSIRGQKARLLYDLTKQYFPDATFEEAQELAEAYNQCGCAYMADADACALQISSLSNGEEVFKKAFGYDLYSKDSTGKSVNVECIAYEQFLHTNAVFRDKSMNEIINTKDSSNATGTWSAETRDFYESKNIGFFHQRSITMNENSEEAYKKGFNYLYTYSKDHPDSVYVLEGTDFDMIRFNTSEYNNNTLHDAALDNATLSGNKYSDVSAHATFVTGTTREGYIVSSWGDKYFVPFEDTFNNTSTDFDGRTVKPSLEIVALDFDFSKLGGVK